MPLRITVRNKTTIPIEVDGIRLEDVKGQPIDAVRRTRIHHGNQQVPLADFFDVDGSADDDHIIWQGDCSHVKLIGAKLASGRVCVEGDAGMHVGAEMTGGVITVNGNTGDWTGAEMHGGRIHVHGNAGHLVGAVYRGGRKGMTDGEILIDGNAGNEVGRGMRRGLIAVGGSVGDAAGFGMLAGSILVFGRSGIRVGAGMRRGTIGLLGDTAPAMLPTFKFSCVYRPVFLTQYLRHLASCGFPISDNCLNADYQRYCGDFLDLGKGEILIRTA